MKVLNRKKRQRVKKNRPIQNKYSLGLEHLEDRMMLSANVPFRVWTQNAQLRPSNFGEVFPGGEAAFAVVSTLVPTAAGLSAGLYEVAVPNTSADNGQRADFILDRVTDPPRSSKPYDIVALQEVFDPDQVEQIRDGAHNLNYSYFSGPDQESISIPLLPDIKYGSDSGLALLVSNAIPTLGAVHQSVEFEAEGSLLAADAWANKGFTLDIAVFEGNPVYVVNTHLHAKDASVRAAQLRQLREFVDRVAVPMHPVLFMGDFNIVDDRSAGSEYRNMLNILQAEDTLQAIGYHTNDNTRNPYAYHWGGEGDSRVQNRLDYILVRQGTETAIEVDNVTLEDTEAITDLFRNDWYRDGSTFVSYLSDHFGLSANLRLVKYSTLNSSTGELSISGGAGNSTDDITLNRSGSDLIVTTIVRGNTYTNRFAVDQVKSITISTGGGNDTVNLEGLPAGLTMVDTGAGNDTINVSRTSSNLANLASANLVVSSSAGFDRLNVYDRAGVGGTYTVRSTPSTMIVDTPSLTITGSGHDQIQLNTSDRTDWVYVNSKNADTHVIVNSGNGNDWFFVGRASTTLHPVQGTLHLNGQTGYDRHYLYDYGTSLARTYDVSSNRIVHALSSNLQQKSTITHYTEYTYVIAGSGNDTFRVNSSWLASPVSVYGKAGSDTVVGPYANNTWDVTGYNSGKLNNKVGFYQVENLSGGWRSDTFRMGKYGAVSNRIDGRGGADILDYSSYSSAVRVDLTWGTATNVAGGMWSWGSVRGIENASGGGGDDVLIGSSGNNILRGGPGNDKLYGRSGHDILVGGWGRDNLYGSYGRDLLIGGTGGDGLDGGYDDDILIAGSTAYDNRDWALARVLAEWTSSRTYDQRVSNIQGGYGSTYGYRLAVDTVFKDDTTDTLTGGYHRDWFWSDPLRYVSNPTPTYGTGLAGGTWIYDWLNDWDSRNEVRSYSS